ncbi:MAG: UPF0164 family protein [Termitinemataceae bacterium]
MKRVQGLLLSIFLVLLEPAGFLYSLDIDSSLYGDISDYLISLYGIDNNQGLTALPVLSIPMGGRAEGLATAFSAVADDASFFEWNPAASSQLSRTELSFYHNNWIADTKIEGLVYTQRFNNFGFALGGKWLYVPFTEYNQFGDRASKGFYSESVGIVNLSYNLFSGYYFSGLAVGTNIKAGFRVVPDYSDDLMGEIIKGSGASQSALAIMIDIGLLNRFNILKFYYSRERNAAVALVGKNIGLPVHGDPLPTEFVAGLSYKPIRPLQFSLDATIPINLQDPEFSEKPYWATGVSAVVTEFLSMRAGLLSKTGNVRITLGSTVLVQGWAVDINYTLDLLTQLQPLNRVSVGIKFDLGDMGRSDRAKRVENLYLLGLNAYAEGDTKAAIEYWESALTLDPGFDPAKESLGAILGSEALSKRIQEIQKIE